ncbi:conserved hypothetical protein [Leishmania major strain Friedlin]|uniref:Uncharacterized protein n=1 Tax=Leishmania major TaxID=5664 RepID=Q4QA92_LEIMA|nr:conserved hypothetical protein [Leishmania major strain Friedlin]CAG9575010.1 hypothetical_protein_-_conserved [Leishmania major strain Friedlin]CAJ04368.1 conserved hypothetical protein [Leishmania major strain Friedlin]|eukprot:XP_001683756.1 conserved hypothetical protein [Leishmania major strain Friedlin]
MEVSTSSPAAGRQALARVEAAVAAATLPLLMTPHRSSVEQREAFLNQVYTDYAELQRQREEIDSRKRQMDFTMFESNRQDIYDVLFANVDAGDGALGDWDTWERVEAVVKRYAYGKPPHTAHEKKEMGAMQSRLDNLCQVLTEKTATVQSLTFNLDAVQKELAGVLKLLCLKESEIRKLNSQNSTAKLQLRHLERECAELRGFRSENKPSVLKKDFGFLIEANKALEQENSQLRRRLNAQESAAGAALTHKAFLDEEAATPCQSPHEGDEAPSFGVTNESLDQCMEDDSYRRKLLRDNIPLSGAIVDAKSEVELWKRRLEAEVSCAMEMLDRDAQLAQHMACMPGGLGGMQEALLRENDVLVSYARYENIAETRPCLKTLSVAVAAALPSFASPSAAAQQRASTVALMDTTTAVPSRTTATSLQDVAPSPEHPLEPLQEQKKSLKSRSSTRASRHKKTASTAAATTAPAASHHLDPPAAASTSLSTKRDIARGPGGGHASAATASAPASSTSAAWMHLKSTVLQCAELSRANALRRELLHAQWFRQQLQGERERVASLVAAQLHSAAQSAEATRRDDAPQSEQVQSVSPTAEHEPVSPALPIVSQERAEALSLGASSSISSAPVRLRHLVQESRPSTRQGDMDGGEVDGCPMGSASDGSGEAGLSASPRRPLRSTSAALHARTSVTWRNPSAQPICTAHARNEPENTTVTLDVLQTSAPCAHAVAAAVSSFTQDGGQVAGGTVTGGAGTGSKTAGARRRGVRAGGLALQADWLRQQVQQLALEAATFGKEVQEALGLLSMLFAQQQLRVRHTPEAEVMYTMKATAQQALEEAAIARAVHLLEQHCGAKLHDLHAVTPKSLPEKATDEEWLAHELRLAALEMLRETPQSHAMCGGDGREYSAGATSKAAGSTPSRWPFFTGAKEDGAGRRAHQFFDEDILQLCPPSPRGTFGTANRWNTPVANGSGGHRGYVEKTREGDDADGMGLRQHVVHEGRRTRGSALQPVPSPPLDWYWVARNFLGVELPGADHQEASQEPRMRVGGFRATAILPPTSAWWHAPPPDIESLRPTVLRYDFGAARRQAQERVSEHVKQATAYICGSSFDDFVRQYIVPIISTATRVTSGSGMDAALRAAVRQLREKARQQCKRDVRLLLTRVANNIRTRNLLRSRVVHGEGFVSYVGVLYNRWRNTLEQERRQVRAEQRAGQASVLSLMHLQAPAGSSMANLRPPMRSSALAPDSGISGDGACLPHCPLQPSSYHFDRVKFGNT